MEIYEKGRVYCTDVEGFDPVDTHIPNNCFINCDSEEMYEYFKDDDAIESAIPYGDTREECIYMIKTVHIKKTIKVTVK